MNAVQQAKARVLGVSEEDMFAPIRQIFSDENYVKRQTARRERYYELKSFRLKHPLLWRLGARPKRR